MTSQWPPRSPHEVLLSTPGGREKLRRMTERQSLSPSPSPSRLRSARRGAAPNLHAEDELDDDDNDDDDDDEEMLQLKLQAIQARLRLKKLQAAKARTKTGSAGAASAGLDAGKAEGKSGPNRGGVLRPESAPVGAQGLREVPLQSRLAAARDRMERSQSQNAIQVPASPVKKPLRAADAQTSPQRVLLGIDKGRRAADVSLKRARSVRTAQEGAAEHQQQPQGGFLRRTRTPMPGQAHQEDATRPLSFNERLASARSDEASRQERLERIQKLRSAAFSVGRDEMEDYKKSAVDLPNIPDKPPEFSRDDVLASIGGQKSLQRSSTVPIVQAGSRLGTADSKVVDSAKDPAKDPASKIQSKIVSQVKDQREAESESASFEPFSGFHLSRRILPHNVLARAITGKKTYSLQELLRVVKAPDWDLPDVESDVVVFAIVASKSDPRHHQPGPGGASNGVKPAQDRGKYMVVKLVDLQYEMELFLFDGGFDRFWKLTPGTVLAVLNPTIMGPGPGREATGRFSLVINSDADTMLEVGAARDLAYCKSVKRDGKPCSAWVNARRTQYCEFHVNEAVRKTRANRVELNDTGFGAGPSAAGRGRWRGNNSGRQDEEASRRNGYDRATQSQWFVSGAHRSVTLLDDERAGGLADRAEREEALKRRLAAQERERNIARRLGQLGGGAGREYMISRAATLASSVSSLSSSTTAVASSQSSQSSSQNTLVPGAGTAAGSAPPRSRPDARALGLVAPRGEQPKIDLGTAKRKRPDSALSSLSSTKAATATATATEPTGAGAKPALGWGTSLTKKLARMKDGEKLDGNGSIEKALAKAAAAAAAISSSDCAAASDGSARPASAREPTADDGPPMRKRTRFVTERGIREAGRESLSEPLLTAAAKARRQAALRANDSNGAVGDDDDDDDLIIVR